MTWLLNSGVYMLPPNYLSFIDCQGLAGKAFKNPEEWTLPLEPTVADYQMVGIMPDFLICLSRVTS